MDLFAVGCGQWGQNIVRTLSDLTGKEHFSFDEVVHTGNPNRAKRVRNNFDLDCHTDLEQALREHSAVCIATPDETHADLVEKALEFEVDVFVEKPLAFEYSTAKDLLEFANHQDSILMPGHLMVYHPLLDTLRDRELNRPGNVDGITVTRYNNLKKSGERRLLHSSLIHDLSLLDALFGDAPDSTEVHEAIGPFPPGRYLTARLQYDNTPVRIRARIDCPFKERSMMFHRGHEFIRFDGLEETLTVADSEQENEETITFETLPLTEELKNFVRASQGKEPCTVTPNHVLRVMETLGELENKAQELVVS